MEEIAKLVEIERKHFTYFHHSQVMHHHHDLLKNEKTTLRIEGKDTSFVLSG